MSTKTGVMYVIVNKAINNIDWDLELHPTKDACIASLCGPRQPYGNDAHDPRPDWRELYEIRRVLPVVATRS